MSHIDDRPPLPAHIDALNAACRALAIAKADVDAARTLLGTLEQGGINHSDPLWIGTRLRLLMGETVLREAMSLHNNSEENRRREIKLAAKREDRSQQSLLRTIIVQGLRDRQPVEA